MRSCRIPNIPLARGGVCARRRVTTGPTQPAVVVELIARRYRDLASDRQGDLAIEATVLQALGERADRRDIDGGTIAFGQSLGHESGQNQRHGFPRCPYELAEQLVLGRAQGDPPIVSREDVRACEL